MAISRTPMSINDYRYFRKRTDERLESIEAKIDLLLEFKNISTGKVIGISLVSGALTSVVIAVIGIYFGVH